MNPSSFLEQIVSVKTILQNNNWIKTLMPLIFSDFFRTKKKKKQFFNSNLCQQGAVNITHWAFNFFFNRKHKNKTYNTTHSKSFCLSDSWCHTMFDRQLPQSLSPSACSHTSQFPLWTKAMWIHTFTSLLSLTPLRLVRGRVNPLLSRTHAAPIHRGSAQNARVQLCGTARSAGWEETRKWVTGQVTALFYFLFFFAGGELALVWASYLSQHSAQEQETWLLTRVGGTQHLNLCLNSVQQSQRLSRGKIKQRAEVGNDRGCWARSRLVSVELWWHHLPGIMGISRKKAQVQHFFFHVNRNLNGLWALFSLHSFNQWS